MKPVWIIDDDRSIRWVFEKALKRENLPSRIFESAEEALRALERDTPGAVLSDIRMPGLDGIEFMGRLKARYPKLPVIIMTAYSDLDSAVSAFQGGAFEYLPKPFDINDALALIHRALEESGHGEEDLQGISAAASQGMLGQAPAMQEVFRAIGRLSQSHATVMITGETGTGKELVAHALHRHSPRRDKPFIALNTAAIPKDLLESELFGHERGAFTGATASRRGRFEQADGGTLFLDEIGDMPPDLQTRLLRVLSDGQFYRVGGHQPLKANVRVIAATHQDLEARVRDGLFREDLLHRLNVIRIEVPPLRQRREDIPGLLRHYLDVAAIELGVAPKVLAPDAEAALLAFDWPGNVRQLVNACRRLTVLAAGREITRDDIPADLGGGASGAPASSDWAQALASWAQARLAAGGAPLLEEAMPEFERTVIREALKATHGGRQEAARLLGWGRNTLTRKLKELGMEDA
jgi:two-component system nitrogen regulation response regulator GlnG